MSLHLDLKLTLLLIMTGFMAHGGLVVSTFASHCQDQGLMPVALCGHQQSNCTYINFIPDKNVSAFLPCPQNVKMTAIDMNYMLHWDWNYKHLENTVNFTAEYAFQYSEDETEPYKRACECSRESWCNFTCCKLCFSGRYWVRVRADAGPQHSNWTYINFIPDEDVLLSSPSIVNVMADIDVLTLTISKSVMSDQMKLKYRVQYWERRKPEQVSFVSQIYNKSSNYTSPQCVYTKGRPLVWQTILAMLCCILLLGTFLYMCHKFRRNSSVYIIPESILAFSSAPLLLELQEECYTIAHVISPAIPLTHTLKEQEHTPELQALQSICQWNDDSVQDSGFSSGLGS
ncbi:interferon alpha/beta receptor 1a isoform X2 [Ictalurus punctatus]|uniref:Interferon alpha/beta receptor 1a isoform X2 n=1 Tax=Ictalurus punctatus TaxID=7998 RepID=A0A2D0R8N0_ICTPU|nr:interferon alpha/beta receptor 1a isoform X2 [Ictalurus punctatus]